MVLLQLLGSDKKKKKLLSVDKDAEFGDIYQQIAEKLELAPASLEGFVVSQLDDRDGEPVSEHEGENRKPYLLPNDKLSLLPRIGGGHFLWVREADANTPAEGIVGASEEGAQEPAPAPAPEPVAAPPPAP